MILIGMPGCGKTSFGVDLSQKLGLDFYDTDELLEEMQGKSIAQIFELEGEAKFREYETEALKAVLLKPAGVISTGGGIVKLQENREILKTAGVVVFIDRPVENILSDLDSESRPLLAADSARIHGLYDERYSLYLETAEYRVLNATAYEEVLAELIKIAEAAI